ncbi:MAG: glycosyltransferase [Planctomycetota bacterium]
MSSTTLVASAYAATLSLLALYGVHRLWLILRFRWRRDAPAPAGRDGLPVVTVQLPLYNERTVVGRLLDCAGALDYPADRLEIQVLDDSTDETREIVDRKVEELRSRGVDAKVVRRPDRVGFKAGALDYGMRSARGELLCVFDADFMPRPSFLREILPGFDDPAIGMVQARWEHHNRDESALTRAQSILLDGHFVIEHTVRSDCGLYFNFNGTAGVWRRRTIEEAGGWQHDTLTEDLDLSYRAQLAGWRFLYVPLVTAPAEVPPSLAAFKSQQHRWAKGSVQVARKLMGTILRADVPLRVKLEALAHLTGNTGYPLVLAISFLLPLTLSANERFAGWGHLTFFLLCTFSVVLFYETSQRAIGRSPWARVRDIPAAISLGIGMCVSQTRAVLEGIFGETGAFVRTPKRGDDPSKAGYRARWSGVPGLEIAFAGWFAWGIAVAVQRDLWGALPFLVLFFSGFAWVGGLSLREWARAR